MNWFKQMVVNWVKEDWGKAGRYEQDCIVSPKHTISAHRGIDSEPTLNFKVYSAIGGKIVEFTRYDRKSDRHDHQVYIINQDQDFGERIAKISTMEILKN